MTGVAASKNGAKGKSQGSSSRESGGVTSTLAGVPLLRRASTGAKRLLALLTLLKTPRYSPFSPVGIGSRWLVDALGAGVQINRHGENLGEGEDKWKTAQSVRVLDLDQTQGEAIASALGALEAFPHRKLA